MNHKKRYFVLVGSIWILFQSGVIADKNLAVHKIGIITETVSSTAENYHLLQEENREKVLSELKDDLCAEIQKLTWEDLVDSQEALRFISSEIKEKYFKVDEHPETEMETIAIGSAPHYAYSDGFKIQEIDNMEMLGVIWDNLYKRHTPKPDVPHVDFDRYLVILAIDNLQTSGGSGIYIKRIKSNSKNNGRAAQVDVEIQRAKSMLSTAVMSRPFHIVKFLRK